MQQKRNMRNKTVIIVPVRSGSKGLSGKNIRNFRGVPLLAYVVQKLSLSNEFDEILVSSDNESYLEMGERAGATRLIKRPDILSNDTASTEEVVTHAINKYEEKESINDRYYLCQVTSPLWKTKDLRGFLEKSRLSPKECIVSVCRSKQNPYYNLLEKTEEGYSLIKNLGIKRRQDHRSVYFINGCFYGFDRDLIINQGRIRSEKCDIFKMNEYRSFDIDSLSDFEFCDFISSYLEE